MSGHKHIDAAVVILSSDGYSDFWRIFLDFFEKNSGLTKLPIYLLSEKSSYEHPSLTVINYPHLLGQPWSDRISYGLQQVHHDYIVAFTEDLLCTRPCTQDDWEYLSDFMLSRDATYLRLAPVPPPSPRLKGKLSSLDPYALHRVSLQPSLWKRSRLLELMENNESPQEFEINGSRRSRSDPNYFCANKPLLNYLEVIGRGLVTRKGARLIRNAGLDVHLTRSLHSPIGEMQRDLSHLKSRLFYTFPTFLQMYLIRNGIVGRAFHG